MRRFNSAIIGMFVIGAIVLAAIGMFAFGARGLWGDRQYFAVFFDESVHGLERGSPVKLKGVRIGRVDSIKISYFPQNGGVLAKVVCEIDQGRVRDATGSSIDLRDPAVLQQMVTEGLQARLNLVGITGMLFVEMDFFGESRRREALAEHPDLVVVPSIPSALAGVADHLANIARQLEAVNFDQIGASVTQLLNTANEALAEARLGELMENLHNTVTALNDILASEELGGTIQAAGRSFEDISRLARRIEAQVDPLAEDFATTTEELRETLDEVAQTFAAIHEIVGPRLALGPQVSETLSTLNEAGRSVQRLADFLERNPQALLRGRGETR